MKNLILFTYAAMLLIDNVFADSRYNNNQYQGNYYNNIKKNQHDQYNNNGKRNPYDDQDDQDDEDDEDDEDNNKYNRKRNQNNRNMSDEKKKQELERERLILIKNDAQLLWSQAKQTALKISRKEEKKEASKETGETATEVTRRELHAMEVKELNTLLDKVDEADREDTKHAAYQVACEERAEEKMKKLGHPTSSPQYKGALKNEIETQKELLIAELSTGSAHENTKTSKKDTKQQAEQALAKIEGIASEKNLDKLEKGAEKAEKMWGRLSGLFDKKKE